jgi:hypothetical protein
LPWPPHFLHKEVDAAATVPSPGPHAISFTGCSRCQELDGNEKAEAVDTSVM